MNEHGRNETDIFRYTDVEYTPDGYSDVYRWDDFLGIAGGHVLSAKCIVDSVPQDCFGFSDPFGGRIEYSEKKPEIAVAVKPDPVELGHRASVAASSTAGGRARGAGIRQ